eukprot:4837753-Amphidinium_carterae.1
MSKGSLPKGPTQLRLQPSDSQKTTSRKRAAARHNASPWQVELALGGQCFGDLAAVRPNSISGPPQGSRGLRQRA